MVLKEKIETFTKLNKKLVQRASGFRRNDSEMFTSLLCQV